jgi:hypothetical protein
MNFQLIAGGCLLLRFKTGGWLIIPFAVPSWWPLSCCNSTSATAMLLKSKFA